MKENNLKKLYGSKKNARRAAYLIRKMNQWIKWYNEHLDWNQLPTREIKYGIN